MKYKDKQHEIMLRNNIEPTHGYYTVEDCEKLPRSEFWLLMDYGSNKCPGTGYSKLLEFHYELSFIDVQDCICDI